MASASICLAMIVKNESQVIERCLDSARPHIDSWVIVDTGSSDATPSIVSAALREVEGDVLARPWRDFGTNRSELISLAKGRADWLLLMDADMVLEADGDDWKAALRRDDVDAWLIDVVGGSADYAMPYLVRGDRPWRYEGVTHEYLTADRDVQRERLPGLRLRHHADGGARGDKFERDRRLLEQHLSEHPDNARTAFYLAQTYRDLGERDLAIEMYRHRVALPGWPEETFFAAYQVGMLLAQTDWASACEAFLAAWSIRPSRTEPLYQLARGCRIREQYAAAYLFSDTGMSIGPSEDILFVEGWIYRWGLRFERSIAAWHVGRRDQCLADLKLLEAREDMPEPFPSFVASNLALFDG